MISLRILGVFAGYAVFSYGLVLMRSDDITVVQWISPLNPYQWPANGGQVPSVPSGQMWPGGSAATAASGGKTPAPPKKPPGALGLVGVGAKILQVITGDLLSF